MLFFCCPVIVSERFAFICFFFFLSQFCALKCVRVSDFGLISIFLDYWCIVYSSHYFGSRTNVSCTYCAFKKIRSFSVFYRLSRIRFAFLLSYSVSFVWFQEWIIFFSINNFVKMCMRFVSHIVCEKMHMCSSSLSAFVFVCQTILDKCGQNTQSDTWVIKIDLRSVYLTQTKHTMNGIMASQSRTKIFLKMICFLFVAVGHA